MPKLARPLTEVEISKARAKAAPYTLADGNGLYLAVSAAGLKAWIVRYRLPDGKQPAPATVGHYPSLSLAAARVRAVEVLRDAKQGKMTAGVRKAQQAAAAATDADATAETAAQAEIVRASFRAVSGRWLAEKRPGWSAETYRKARLVVDSHLMPVLGDTNMRTVETKDVRPVLVSMSAGTPALAKKARQYVAGIVEHAINEGLRADESMLRLGRILPPSHSGHMPSVTEDEAKLGEIMRAIEGYPGSVVRAALTLTALTVVRPGVAAAARWADMHLKSGEWRIPAEAMKTRQPFNTSLPTQVLEVLREMHARRGDNEYVFPPQARQQTPHLHRDSLSRALRELGFQGEHSAHGFRASLRTLGRERLRMDVDVLEAQLAHAPKDEVAAAYARVKFKEQRREVMQAWADYLDKLKAGNVVEFKRKA